MSINCLLKQQHKKIFKAIKLTTIQKNKNNFKTILFQQSNPKAYQTSQ